MKRSVKKVMLYKDLSYSKNENCIKDESLTLYKNGVFENDLEPKVSNYLLDEVFCGYSIYKPIKENGIPTKEPVKLAQAEHSITKGCYYFIQGIEPKEKSQRYKSYAIAAQELWLESIWNEIKLDPKTVYMRKLKENDIIVFQLFRKIII